MFSHYVGDEIFSQMAFRLVSIPNSCCLNVDNDYGGLPVCLYGPDGYHLFFGGDCNRSVGTASDYYDGYHKSVDADCNRNSLLA